MLPRLLVIVHLVVLCECYNVLVVFPHPGRSHFAIYEPLFTALAAKGHNVTSISYFPNKDQVANYRDVSLGDSDWAKDPETLSIEDLSYSRINNYWGIFLLGHYARRSCPQGLTNANLRNFLKEKNNYDVVLFQYFISNCFMGIAKKFQAPVIGLSSNLIMPWFPYWFGTPNNPSYIPNANLDHTTRMTFYQRIENTIMLHYQVLLYKFVLERPANEYSKKYLGVDLEEGGDVLHNTSMLFSPTHYTLHGSYPVVPAIIEVGGLHIREPRRLPDHLEKYVNDSADGVIYFSMGSTLKGHTFPKDKRLAFLKNFEKLPQRVIWKFEQSKMEGKPDNLLLERWTPQLDLICHPNVKAFIFHGGLLSTLEAVHCGIPLIVIPQFADQFRNAKALEENGGAVVIKMSDVSEETVADALRKVLTPEYKRKAQQISQQFKDRPLTPLDNAIYWVEYVARHKGAPQLRSAAADMPFYQYYLLDVSAFLFTIFVLIFFTLYMFVRLIWRLLITLLKFTSKENILKKVQ